MEANKLEGVYTALFTPLREDKNLDYEKLDRLIEDQIAAGITGILALGTTGLGWSFSNVQHIDLVEHIFNRINGRCQFLAGGGSNSTLQAISLTKDIERRIGPFTSLHVTGYYNGPHQDGLVQHFEGIAEALREEDSRIIMYNVPGRTNSDILPSTVHRLRTHPRIIGIKEASTRDRLVANSYQFENTSTFRVLSGEDHLYAELLGVGGSGIISASANIAPKIFLDMYKYARDGEIEQSFKLQERAKKLIDFVFSAKNPIPLAHMFCSALPLPLTHQIEVDEGAKEIIEEYSVEELGIDLAAYR